MITDIPFDPYPVIPAGDVVCFGVAAPTAPTANYYVRVQSAYMLFREV